MNLSILSNLTFFLSLSLLPLFFVSFVRSKDIEVSKDQEVKPIHELFEESSDEDQFPSTTTELADVSETYRKSSLSATGKSNVSTDFKPSVHLGEIQESRINSGPFNNLHHIKLEDGENRDSYLEHQKDFRLVFQPTAQSLSNDRRVNYRQNFYETLPGSSEENQKNLIEQNNYVKFQDGVLDVSKYQYGGSLNDQGFRQQFAHAVNENADQQYDLVDQQVFHNPGKPVYDQDTSTYLVTPPKFQDDLQKNHVEGIWGVDGSKTPQYGGYYNHQGHQGSSQQPDFLKKPSNGVVYIQESSFSRTRKFPYPIYQSPGVYQQMDFIHEGHPNYSVSNSVSPWKKILHLVGTFLPLGLLIAALTPRVIKVNNSTDPSITLSKWRANDLPIEHKLARFRDTRNYCEEKSICDMILADDDARSTVLRNILRNLAYRTSTATAKESGLEEIFEAVKKKDCTSIVC